MNNIILCNDILNKIVEYETTSSQHINDLFNDKNQDQLIEVGFNSDEASEIMTLRINNPGMYNIIDKIIANTEGNIDLNTINIDNLKLTRGQKNILSDLITNEKKFSEINYNDDMKKYRPIGGKRQRSKKHHKKTKKSKKRKSKKRKSKKSTRKRR